MKVAIIDDYKDERDRLSVMIAKPFSAYGYNVTEIEQFSSGEEFLQTFSANKYNIIFLDIFMGDMDGIETAKKIRETDTLVKLIFVTTSNDFASESYMVNADGYLLKPYSEEALLKTIRHLDFSYIEASREIRFCDGQSTPLRSVLYTSYYGHYVTVHLISGDTIKVRTSQNQFTEWLSPYPEFYSCNKGLIVNLQNVKKLDEDYFVMSGNIRVPVSRRRLADAKKQYTEYLVSQIYKGGC